MILADTSAWVEYLRGSGHPTDRAMQQLARSDTLIITEPVVLELLAGAPTERRAEAIRRVLARHLVAPVGGVETFEVAAGIYRSCRRRGETIRRTMDCLIAAVALRVGVPILHNDRDFDVIARHTELRVMSSGT